MTTITERKTEALANSVVTVATQSKLPGNLKNDFNIEAIKKKRNLDIKYC